jgi:Zn-dependent M16 (insulinase) family peptidase
MTFSAGLKGVAIADAAEKVEPLILDTLAQLADDGIDPDDDRRRGQHD